MNHEIDTLFANKTPSLLFVFDKLLSFVIDFGEMDVRRTKNCILFHHNQTFLVIKPMKSMLNIKFYLSEFEEEFPVYKTAMYGKQFEHHIRISSLEEVNDRVVKLIRKSYQLFQ